MEDGEWPGLEHERQVGEAVGAGRIGNLPGHDGMQARAVREVVASVVQADTVAVDVGRRW